MDGWIAIFASVRCVCVCFVVLAVCAVEERVFFLSDSFFVFPSVCVGGQNKGTAACGRRRLATVHARLDTGQSGDRKGEDVNEGGKAREACCFANACWTAC